MMRFGVATNGLLMADGKPLYEFKYIKQSFASLSLDMYLDDFCQVILNDLFSDDGWRLMSIGTFCGDDFVFDVWLNLHLPDRAHVYLMFGESDVCVDLYSHGYHVLSMRIPLIKYNGELVEVVPLLLGTMGG